MAAQVLRMSEALTSVEMQGRPVKVFAGRTVTQRDLECAVQSKVFIEWVMKLNPQIVVEEIAVQGIYYRSREPDPNKVLFIMIVANVLGSFPQSIVLRGPTVAILPILVCKGKEYTIGTLQRRPATGERFLPELPAGMTDGGDIVSKALQEIKEETGIDVKQSELEPLGGPYEPTPGLVSEPMFFFFFRREVTRAQLDSFEGKLTGAIDEGEEIILKIMPLDHLRLWATRDMKAHFAWFLYRERFPKLKRRLWFF